MSRGKVAEKTTEITIEARVRQATGKGNARKMRKAGMIPANLNDGGKSVSIELDPKNLPKAVKSGGTFGLVFEGKTRQVKIQELQIDTIKRTAVHVDLVPVK